MPKIPFVSGFKDPVRRPRYIIWTGVLVILLAAFVIVALGVTSTYWFCAEVCHKVQDDTITAYNNSSHSEISCMACHMPVNADPITFVLHKMTALGELYLTATEKYEIPLNHGSHLSMDAHHMGSEQCTQCHSANREITPSDGIIIDHDVHAENAVTCTMCHNRIAHNEDGIEFVNIDPATDELNEGHPDFMMMTACFRCHTLESDGDAPGECAACHPKDFELKPPSHFETDFYPGGHAEMALEDHEAVEAAMSEGHGEEGAEEHPEEATDEHSEEPTESEDADESHDEDAEESDETSLLGVESAFASDDEHEKDWAAEIPTVNQVSYCSTCHLDTFCSNCHGMDMPHPAEFVETEHPDVAAEKMDKCDLCHQVVETEYFFCNDCHHGEKSDWEYDANVEWQTQHADTVTSNGVDICLEACHEVAFCSDCHTELKPYPTSHQDTGWLRKAAAEIGDHAEISKAQPQSCEVCHGADIPNGNSFCQSCHVLDMPHPQEFKEFHAKTGRDNPAVCANCHTYKELCSDCHHDGAKDGTAWQAVHGPVVNENGAVGCFEKCHQEEYCVECHTTLKVVPVSHAGNGWTRRATASEPALHPAAYNAQADSCTYCHGDGGTESAFCMGCHALEMPHPIDGGNDQMFLHKDEFAAGDYAKATCTNCHGGAFCNDCHHGYTGSQPWVNYHPATVKDTGATDCFECHEETYCSYCHVREASKYLNNTTE